MQNAQCGICEGRFESGRRQTLGWESRKAARRGPLTPPSTNLKIRKGAKHMSEEVKKSVEGTAQGLNEIPQEARSHAVSMVEAYAQGLAAGVALANKKEEKEDGK